MGTGALQQVIASSDNVAFEREMPVRWRTSVSCAGSAVPSSAIAGRQGGCDAHALLSSAIAA